MRCAWCRGRDRLAKITISGHPGSGTSTLVKGLESALGWTSINGGDVFRSAAKDRNLSLSEFATLCKEDERVDRELDARLQSLIMEEGGPEIVESRLAGWWAYRSHSPCIRLWLEVEANERARRVVNREGGTLEEQLDRIMERQQMDGARFKEMYQILPEDPEPYSHRIEASTMDIDQVIQSVLNLIEEA